MPALPLPADHAELRAVSRLAGVLGASPSLVTDYAAAFFCGIIAALATSCIDLNLRLPGHAILKVVLPISLGFALAPRRGAGLLESCGAAATLGVLGLMGQPGNGVGATLSLLSLGPLCDLALLGTRHGWQVPLRFALAGLAANCLAFAARGGKKAVGLDGLTMRPLAEWLSVAPLTYAACGLAAGLLCSLILFRLTAPPPEKTAE